MRDLASLLPEALARLRVRKPVEAAVVCRAVDQKLGELWDHAVPMRAISYRDGVVTVAVMSSSWGMEVRNRELELVDQINELLSQAPVRSLKVRVAPTAAQGET